MNIKMTRPNSPQNHLDDLNKQELLDILKANLSSGAYTKLDNEKPMEKRSKSDLLHAGIGASHSN